MVNVSDAEIKERDGNRCARDGNTLELHVHHRWMRSAGHDESAANRIVLCASCHRWVHNHPEEAMEYGWLVSRYGDPAEVRVNHWLWPAGPVWLEPDGGIRLI